MRTKASMSGLKEALDAELARFERAATAGMTEAAEGLAEEYRAIVFKSLGYRLSNTVKAEVYPRGATSMEPAGYIWFKAPRIINFFAAERVVTPIGGAFAIPVNPVVKRGGQAMTTVEVEARFNQELEPRLLKSGHLGLFLDLLQSKSKRRPGFRAPTRGRIDAGRRVQKTLMFVLVRQLGSRKLIDLEGPAQRWAAKVPALIDKHWEK
jgi:hypothetical protein